jgi:hypothetical protein
MPKKRLKIEFHHYSTTCGDGCCSDYGLITIVDGKKLFLHNEDIETVVQQLLDHLGIEAEVEETYDTDDED